MAVQMLPVFTKTPSSNSSGLLLNQHLPQTDFHSVIALRSQEGSRNKPYSKIALHKWIKDLGQVHQSVHRKRGAGLWLNRRLKVSGPDEEEKYNNPAFKKDRPRRKWSKFWTRLWVNQAGVCGGLCVSGASGEHQAPRVCLGSSDKHMSLARGSCGSWRRRGGSRCYTCYTLSWPDQQKASCRNR